MGDFLFFMFFGWIFEATAAESTKLRFIIQAVLRTLFHGLMVVIAIVGILASYPVGNWFLFIFFLALGCLSLTVWFFASRSSLKNYQLTYQ